ncbi:MAG: adenylate/guanylate cyclase domain-containing protein, partial [Alphaproteobacteria bacterium]|nr:adenylate/guanylate cyclase domain-containing protein [Alphaproteobacteria bacterium]
MAEESVRQRVAAILAADAVGYTRLMADDEQATIDALDAARAVFVENIEANQGRVVDTAGDSVLAVFETTEGAVLASVAIQDRLTTANEPLPETRRMHFRIGLHLGDIREKSDGSIYGDGVNIAARLEGLAEPGSIIVSDLVHGALRDRLDIGFADAGIHDVKNVKNPVQAYRVLPDGPADSSALSVGRAPKALRKPKLVAGLAVGLAVLAGLAIWGTTIRVETPQMVQADGTPTEDPALAMPLERIIAVLPFKSLSGDPEHEYFARGVTEDILTRLAQFPVLGVIASNSSFKYQADDVDVSDVGAALGATFVLQGSVRRLENTIRVTAQLFEAEGATQVWAER